MNLGLVPTSVDGYHPLFMFGNSTSLQTLTRTSVVAAVAAGGSTIEDLGL